MKTTPRVDMAALLLALARRLKVEAGDLVAATLQTPMFASPGNITDDEKPMTPGTKLNLRRGFPSGQHPEDQGWYVVGYTRRRDQRWTGYILARPTGSRIFTTTLSNAEVVDVLEKFQVLP